MYKYTPKKSILRDMQVPRVGRWWDNEYHKINEILKKYKVGSEYLLTNALQEDFPRVTFFSPELVRKVPVRGFLFPVEMFDVEQTS